MADNTIRTMAEVISDLQTHRHVFEGMIAAVSDFDKVSPSETNAASMNAMQKMIDAVDMAIESLNDGMNAGAVSMNEKKLATDHIDRHFTQMTAGLSSSDTKANEPTI